MKKFKVDYWPTTTKQIVEIVGEDLEWQYDTVNSYEEEKKVYVILGIGVDEHEAFYQGDWVAMIEFPWESFKKGKNGS